MGVPARASHRAVCPPPQDTVSDWAASFEGLKKVDYVGRPGSRTFALIQFVDEFHSSQVCGRAYGASGRVAT